MKASDTVRITHAGYLLQVPDRGVHALTEYVTDDEKLFIVTHMALIEIDPSAWCLRVDGMVRRPCEITLEQILSLPQYEVTSVHECAGSPLTPLEAKRRVGNVVWAGPRLSDVLHACGIEQEASYVWSEGLEWGEFAGIQNQPFVKDLPIEKALAPEVLLAVAMNGRPLRAERGGPVRLVVPGWYGTNSVKWLGRITLAGTRAPGPYTTRFYNDLTPTGSRPVWQIAPECVVVSPANNDSVTSDRQICIEGWAWADAGVIRVEISVDGRQSWAEAELDERRDFGWQHFRFHWTPAAGEHQLSCRCFDAHGAGQPDASARNEIHSVVVSAS
ncbi:molybdopterin-dependent oxidoreductase [Trinickia dinghuensis]|uniref:Molybdenum-binding oxidoreductase n=1 Tax=Trinickia dinghuensis TaxID=2291023 RepID=A0A3D8K7B3_9BURK|nr:molybdopterin-dependent oxidoreductase [Trinickia dinghuensis]RDV00472.1 molybdenum-binding oxidoreductase [Trinickia dinghuensis]